MNVEDIINAHKAQDEAEKAKAGSKSKLQQLAEDIVDRSVEKSLEDSTKLLSPVISMSVDMFGGHATLAVLTRVIGAVLPEFAAEYRNAAVRVITDAANKDGPARDAEKAAAKAKAEPEKGDAK